MKKLFFCAFVALAVFSLPSEGKKKAENPFSNSSPMFWNMDGIQGMKDNPAPVQKFIDRCVARADEAIKSGPVFVTAPSIKVTPDPHYFFGSGKYFWPDPKNPNGPYINKDGLINPESKNYDTTRLEQMKNNLRHLALALFFTGDKKYYTEYVKHVRAWFLDKDTYMYPNMVYAQVIPGRNNGMGFPAGIIHAYSFTSVLDSYRLVNSVIKIDKKTDEGLKDWFRQLMNWMKTSDIGVKESKGTNNHSVAYDVMMADFAVFVGDKETYDNITGNFRKVRLEAQIREDGSQPRELARTRALGYSVYNLTHFVDLCLMMEKQGRHYYAENRDLIDKVFLFLDPYIDHRESWTYQDIAKSFDKDCRDFKKQVFRLRQLPDGGRPILDNEKYIFKGKDVYNYLQ